MSHIKTEEIVIKKTLKSSEYVLIVYNDDFNTFEHVIETLMDLCGHTAEQAEQCTFLIHYKGKCDVMRGTAKQLKLIFAALGERGLTAAIEK
jgi:ATP-dependent Clp protease adaptor protein ClpS